MADDAGPVEGTVAVGARDATMIKASDLLVRALETEGVAYVFGVPGEENLDLLESLAHSDIELVLTRHEQAAGFMAATYGRFTGKAGVCLSTLGPGATNLMTAAAYATLGGMPMLMLTGQKPIKSSKQGRFQILDVVDMMAPVTKYTHQVVSGANVASRVREAVRLAEEEKPGATHIELPEDVARDETDGQVVQPSYTRRPIPEEKAIRAACDKILAASAPLLVIGAGANRKLTSKMLTEFVERCGIPFVTTQLGKGVVDERSDLFMGCAALSSGDFVHRAIGQADLIVNVGHDVIEKPPFFMKPDGPAVVHINFRPAEVDPVYFPQLEVVGDIANAIWQIKERLSCERCGWDLSRMKEIRRAHDDHIEKGAEDDRFPIYPQRLVAEVRRALPSDGIVCLDNGIYKIWFARNYLAHAPNTVILDNALASMGAGLPSAMAARIVHPDRRIVAVVGDGGFMMNSQELETAVRLGLDLTVVILNDAAYGMIRWKQTDMGFRDWGLSFGNPDFVAYARSYGAEGYRPDSVAEFAATLERCLSAKGVHVIDCPVDYTENDRILHHQISKLSAAV